MRAVIYARYSSDHQREASTDDQVRICRALIDRSGWQLVDSYADRAMSGATAIRPGYLKLLEDAMAGRFEVLVAEALDRLSRDQEDIAGLFKRLSFWGVRIVTVSEGEISALHVGLKGTMNALFLKDLALKVHRGLEGRVRGGQSGGGNSYGYSVVKNLDASGEVIRGARAINPAEASIVVRIFSEFAAGASPREIARRLNAEKVPGSQAAHWRDTTIRGHQGRANGILNNPLYQGRLVWNRVHYVKDPQTGKRVYRINPPEKWVVIEVPHLRIVDQDLWDAVKRRQAEISGSDIVRKIKATPAFWTKRRAKYLLTGKVQCGCCGGVFASVGKDFLACGNARSELRSCGSGRSIKRPILEDLVLDALRNELMHPDLVKEFVSAFNEEINRQSQTRTRERSHREKELAETTRKMGGLIEAIADGLRTPGTLARLQELEAHKASFEAELALQPTKVVQLHPRLADVYREKLANLGLALRDDTLRQEAIDTVRALIDVIVLRPEGKTGFEIELQGKLAAMFALSHEKATRDGLAVADALSSSAMVLSLCRSGPPEDFKE